MQVKTASYIITKSSAVSSVSVSKVSTYDVGFSGLCLDAVGPSSGDEGNYSPPLYSAFSSAVAFPGETAESSDTPALNNINPYFDVVDGAGNTTATYSYSNAVAYMKGSFSLYAVLFNIDSKNASALREVNWYMNLSSEFPGQQVRANTTDETYTSGMITSGSTANQILNSVSNPWQRSTTQVNIS